MTKTCSGSPGTHMIVLPGGGYAAHAPHEAEPVARWLGEIGVQASVFRYPLNVRYPVLSRRLRQHGIAPRQSRNAALAAWAAELPAPVLADILGLNVTTAEAWAQRTRRDWTAYIAERATPTAPSGTKTPEKGHQQHRE